MKVSIIVPIFNCERYLDRCIKSICNQSLRDIEIICVDDCSTDGSNKILLDFANRDSRIKVMRHDINKGLVAARKTGVNEAAGEYVGFVDGDDWIEPHMYANLYRLATEHDADMVSSGYILEGGYVSEEYDSIDEGLYGADRRQEILDKLIFNMRRQDLGIRGSLCCKLFKRGLIADIQNRIPDEITYSEDKMCVLTFALECKSIYVVRRAWYHYIINSASMTQRVNVDYLDKVNAVYRYLVSLYTNPDFTDSMRMQAELYITQLLIKGINSRMGFSIKNLMWIGSEWMYKIPGGSRVLLYGEGELCKTYERLISSNDNLVLVGVVNSAADVSKYGYDHIVITYKYVPKVDEIKDELLRVGVSSERILWFEQKEIFWDFAESAGLC